MVNVAVAEIDRFSAPKANAFARFPNAEPLRWCHFKPARTFLVRVKKSQSEFA